MNLINCACTDAPQKYLQPYQHLGSDREYAEISVLVCRICGQLWLRYFYELESCTGSGRWYLGPIGRVQLRSLTLERAKSVLEGLDWYYFGGSYYQGRTSRASGQIILAH